MTLDEVMNELKGLKNEAVYKHNAKAGAGDNQFGVKTADIRTVAKSIKTDPDLAAQLWKTGNADAMLLATLMMKPKQLTMDEIETLVRSVSYVHVADWLNSNVVKAHPQKEELRQKWMASGDVATQRAAWSLTTERIRKEPDGMDIPGLLDRIEKELGDGTGQPDWRMDHPKWTVNYCLAEIGIKYPEYRKRATEIGEKCAAFRDFPCSKGCVSPYAPSWIAEMVKRQG